MANTDKYYEALTPFNLGLGALRDIVKAHMKQPQVVDIHAVMGAITAFQYVSDHFVKIYKVIYPEGALSTIDDKLISLLARFKEKELKNKEDSIV